MTVSLKKRTRLENHKLIKHTQPRKHNANDTTIYISASASILSVVKKCERIFNKHDKHNKPVVVRVCGMGKALDKVLQVAGFLRDKERIRNGKSDSFSVIVKTGTVSVLDEYVKNDPTLSTSLEQLDSSTVENDTDDKDNILQKRLVSKITLEIRRVGDISSGV